VDVTDELTVVVKVLDCVDEPDRDSVDDTDDVTVLDCELDPDFDAVEVTEVV
jgi:hypothetical protein